MIARINSLMRNNIFEKLVAIVAATVLWVVVMEDQNPVIEGSYTVPLSFVNVPEGYKVLHGSQPIKIQLRGPRSYFVNYEDKDCRAYSNLGGLEEGDHEVKIEASFPPGFELIAVTPDQTQIKLDPYIEKQMPADLIVTGADESLAICRDGDDNRIANGGRVGVEGDRICGVVGEQSGLFIASADDSDQ